MLVMAASMGQGPVDPHEDPGRRAGVGHGVADAALGRGDERGGPQLLPMVMAEADSDHEACGHQEDCLHEGGDDRARRAASPAGGADAGQNRGVEPRRRFGRRAGLQEGVGGGGEFQEQRPAAEAEPDVVEDRAPAIVGQHTEGEFA